MNSSKASVLPRARNEKEAFVLKFMNNLNLADNTNLVKGEYEESFAN